MTASVQQARQALGARLREIRNDADLTGRALAAATGWHFIKVGEMCVEIPDRLIPYFQTRT